MQTPMSMLPYLDYSGASRYSVSYEVNHRNEQHWKHDAPLRYPLDGFVEHN